MKNYKLIKDLVAGDTLLDDEGKAISVMSCEPSDLPNHAGFYKLMFGRGKSCGYYGGNVK